MLGYLVGYIQWENALLFFAVIYALSGLCWLPLNPNGSLFEDDRPKASD